jgi:DNA-binding NarL/FixJ family response regulator
MRDCMRVASDSPRRSGPNAHSAVVADRWPLMRIGLARAVSLAGMRVAGEGRELGDAVAIARQAGADVLLVGDADAVATADLRRAAANTVVVTLVRQATRERLSALFTAGVAGISLRSATLEELADLLRRAVAGERAVAKALLPSLIDRNVTGVGFAPSAPLGPVTVGDALLTAKEREVLGALAVGATNQEIAAQLFVTPATVKTHLAHIYSKLEVKGRHEALSRAVALGIVH